MNNLYKSAGLLLSLATLFSACSGAGCVSGSGNQVSQDRQVGEFTRVEISGSIKVILKQDSVNALRIIADDNIQNEVNTDVYGNRLVIDMDDNICDAGPITIYMSSKMYESVEASGAVQVSSDGRLNVNNFDLGLSGASKVDLEIDAADVTTSSSGSSEIALRGQAGSHEIDMSGSASVDALDFVVGRYDIESSGSSKSRINVLNELNISSSGSSDVEYRGNPSRIKNNESGASSLRKID